MNATNGMLFFKNPMNSYIVSTSGHWAWCLLFGTFYFMKHGAWAHVFLSFVLAIITMGVSWLIYPFFAKGIIRNAYLKKGWLEVK